MIVLDTDILTLWTYDHKTVRERYDAVPDEETIAITAIVPDVVRALRAIDNARAVDLLHSILDDPSNPDRDWLAMTLAGTDLMNATQPLRVAASGGDLGVLLQALGAAGAALRQLNAPETEIADAVNDPAEMTRASTDLMRRLEETLRSLARGEA